jgi:fluoride exporter
VSGAPLWIGVAALGGAGAVARYLISTAVARRGEGWFPWGTLAVNLSGTFVLGLLAGVARRGDATTLAGGGLLGSYTTYSTWMLDSERLAEHHSDRALATNLLGSLLLGLAAVALGRAIG